MKATLTRFALAAMIAAGVTDVLADGITVSEDTASTYVPTTIVNGSFDDEPWMDFSMTNGTETYTYTRENRDWNLFSSSGTIKACYPNGVNGGWNTTENQPYQGTLFEYTCNLSGYNTIIPSPSAANYFVEMNANNSAVLYQDLGTCGNDVIRWSLKHAVRTSAGVNVQSMRVEIGAPEYSGENIVAAQGVNENVDSRIQSATKAVYRASGITNPAGNAYGFNGSNLDKLSLSQTSDDDKNSWHTVTGVYVVPAGQSVTRFGFIAEMKMDENPSCGNLLDDITFSTLIGNLSARQLESYDVELKGYWGETDATKCLKVVIGSITYDVDMTSVVGKNFKIVIPAATIGSATSVHVYHQDYEDAGRTISLMSALESWNRDYTGDIQTFTAPCSGIYQLRVWGAQGGSRDGNGGQGGYATCRTMLTKGETIYVYVGGRGGDATGNGGAGGWNGGGKGGAGYGNLNGSGGGGGATHISKVNNQIIGNGCTFLGGTDYIVVAGGGGGKGFWNATPGNGGGTEGGLGSRHSGSNYSDDFYYSTTQSVGANGGNGNSGGWNGEGSGGGGGGYYGGTANYPYSTFPDEGYDNNASGCGGNSACNSDFATAFSTTAGQRKGNGMAEINLLIRGKGTADDPCLIGNEQELKNFAALVNSGNANLHGKLTAPIDLEGSQANQWTPIGTSSYPYNGTFDGQGFTISNLYFVQKEGNVGLFGCAGASARIKNIRVVGYIDNSGSGATAAGGSTTAGGILGRGESGTVIINCSVAGSVLSFSNVGGIAGSGAVTIVNCYNEATVKFYSDMGQVGGGIYGWGGSANTPTLVNCYNVGQIINTGTATSHMGNITAAATATDCYSLANCCQNGAGAGWSNGAANQISGSPMTSEAMHSASFVSTLNGNAALLRSVYPDIEDWMLHPTTSLPVHKNSIKYAIEYNLNGGHASNAAYYDVTTATFTLNNPTKEGYLFTGWTGSNGDTPQTVVTVAQGSTGNRAYTANWISWDEVNAHVGKVIGADGKLYKTVAAATNAGTTPSGVVAYWGAAGSVEASNSDYRGLAISLVDVARFIPWCTDPSAWFAGSTLEQALEARNGWERTDAFGRPNSRDVEDIYGHHHNHQAAAAVYDYNVSRPTGASPWFIPTMGQWNLVAQGLTGSTADISTTDNPDYTFSNLSAKLTVAGASGLAWAAYWSSTEVDGSNMWVFDIGGIGEGRNGSWALSLPKTWSSAEFVRPFFAFEDATDAIYTISYNANDGSGAPSAQTKDGGIDLSLSGAVPTRAGYVFKGWNTAADGSGTSYASGATFTGNVDTTLYAQWGGYGAWAEENGIAGAWNATDESGVPNAFRYVFDQPAGELEAVSGVDVVGSSVVMTSPEVKKSDGFTVKYEIDRVAASGEVLSEGTASESANDLGIDFASVKSNAFFKVAMVLESTGGAESRTKALSDTTIGVIAITNAPATAIIGVPFKSLSDGGSISVSNLVHTANLTAGDELKAFDADGKLHSWTLTDGAWVPDYVSGGTGTEMSEDADKIKLARGKGVWLTRQHPEEPIYLVGQVAEGNASTPLEKPKETGSQTWNLVASPKVEPVDVAQLLAGRQATDKVMVPTAGAPKNFIYSASAGKWGYIDYQTDENGFVRAYFVTDDTTVPAGTGFWYLNGNSEHDSLDWEE